MATRIVALFLLLGSLSVAAADEAVTAGHPPAALFVFDASGSMLRKVEGKPKDEIARAVMSGVLTSLDPQVRVGLVTFGHRRKGDCKDLEVVAPVGSDRGAIAAVVEVFELCQPLRHREVDPRAAEAVEDAAPLGQIAGRIDRQ